MTKSKKLLFQNKMVIKFLILLYLKNDLKCHFLDSEGKMDYIFRTLIRKMKKK